MTGPSTHPMGHTLPSLRPLGTQVSWRRALFCSPAACLRPACYNPTSSAMICFLARGTPPAQRDPLGKEINTAGGPDGGSLGSTGPGNPYGSLPGSRQAASGAPLGGSNPGFGGLNSSTRLGQEILARGADAENSLRAMSARGKEGLYHTTYKVRRLPPGRRLLLQKCSFIFGVDLASGPLIFNGVLLFSRACVLNFAFASASGLPHDVCQPLSAVVL